MKRMVLICLTLAMQMFVFNTRVNAQKTDTIWYNKQHQETTKVADRDYYKVIKYNNQSKLFDETGYSLNGKVMFTGSYSSLKPLVRTGLFVSYDKNGLIISKVRVDHDIITETINYQDGKQSRHLVNKDHPPVEPINDQSAQYTTFGKPLTADEMNSQPAGYADGEAALSAFIQAHTVYPKEAKERKITGTVFIEIKINAKGVAYETSIQRPSDALLNAEAMRVALSIPNKWKPAKNAKNQPIDGAITVPIRFLP